MPAAAHSARPSEYAEVPVPASAGTGRWKKDAALLACLWGFGTLLLFLFRPGYSFPPYEVVDGWIYTSYQWDLREQIKDFGPTYYGSRLSWILPGALIHSLLPPLAANILYKLIVSGLFATACATILYRAAGMPGAILGVALSLFDPQFIGALHSDYVDTPVIVYATMTMACITVARDSPRWAAWIFLGGCCFSGMVIANLGSIGSPGLGIAVFHLLWLRWGFKRQATCAGIYVLAASIVLVVAGWIHVRAGGAFYFLKPQIDMVLYFHKQKTNPWSAANWLWLHRATWLVLPAAGLLWGLRAVIAKPTGQGDVRRLAMALTAALFVSLAWALKLETKGLSVLSLNYYASYQLSLALPLLAVLCWSGSGGDQARSGHLAPWLLVGALILFCFFGKPLYGWTSLVPLHRLVHTPESMPLVGAAGLLLIGLVVALGILPKAMRLILRPELMVLGLLACSTSKGFRGPEISDRLRERYSLIYQTNQVLAREFPRGSYLFWVHPEERNGVSLAQPSSGAIA